MWYTINSLIMRAKASKKRAKSELMQVRANKCERMRTEKKKCSQKLKNARTEDSGGRLVVSASFVLYLR